MNKLFTIFMVLMTLALTLPVFIPQLYSIIVPGFVLLITGYVIIQTGGNFLSKF